MKRPFVYLPLAVLTLAVTACSTPKQDGGDLKAAIDASVAGHYGQALLQAEQAEDHRAVASHVLEHIEKGYYWNINEKQKGIDAAKQAEQHRIASEKEMCAWLTESHSDNHHFHNEAPRKAAAFFKTGSAIPYKVNVSDIATLGRFLKEHPNASANVIASTDTVGKSPANQTLSENRARTVSDLLIKNGARPAQLNIKAIGEAAGPDNTANQDNRAVLISTTEQLSVYTDCSKFK